MTKELKKKCKCGDKRTFEQHGIDQNGIYCFGCKRLLRIVKKTKITDGRK